MMSHASTTTCPLTLMNTADKKVTERSTGVKALSMRTLNFNRT